VVRFVRVLGSRKMWLRLRSQGHEVARCTVERIMRQRGWEGARWGRAVRTTVPAEHATRPADLVQRQFDAMAPNRLWVADFTYVPAWDGMVYVAFMIGAFSRRITGWQAATSRSTQRAATVSATSRCCVHRLSPVSTPRSRSPNGSCRLAPIPRSGQSATPMTMPWPKPRSGCTGPSSSRPRGPWRDLDQVEAATLEWVHWYNTERTHQAIDDLTPVAAEEIHYRFKAALEQVG
jgi:putative transposase